MWCGTTRKRNPGYAMKVDYLIVGSGLTGAVIARMLRDAGEHVVVVDRRDHVGGNVHDHAHESGIRVHTYGPHYFRTSSDKIWRFVNRFSSFYKFEGIIQTLVDGRYENWPVSAEYLERTVGKNWHPSFSGHPNNFEEASLSLMPETVYRKFVKGYSEKQWGVSASNLSANLAKRFEVRQDNDPRLKQCAHQGIPTKGYADFTKNILAGIPVILNFNYLANQNLIEYNKLLIFTGPIDEFFDFRLGHLTYRGQKREHQFYPNESYRLPCGQINNPDPDSGPHVRTLEWKHMMPKECADGIRGTLLTTETPITPESPEDYEYPFPDEGNQRLYQLYRDSARRVAKLLICGRLGEYRYFDMDQAIARAMMLAERILESRNGADTIRLSELVDDQIAPVSRA